MILFVVIVCCVEARQCCDVLERWDSIHTCCVVLCEKVDRGFAHWFKLIIQHIDQIILT